MRNRLIPSGALACGVAALSLLTSGVAAQETSTPPATQDEAVPQADPAVVNARQNRTDDQAVAGFLDRKRERQARRETALGRRGAGGDQQELRRLYRALNIPRPTRVHKSRPRTSRRWRRASRLTRSSFSSRSTSSRHGCVASRMPGSTRFRRPQPIRVGQRV